MASDRLDAHEVHELLRAATDRTPLEAQDGKSGARLERIVADGRSYVVKRGSWRDDWGTLVAGDRVGWARVAWDAGLLDRLPPVIDHTIVGIAAGERDHDEAVVLMDDVGAYLVPEGDEVIGLEQHARFMEHMAALHAAFWNWHDDIGLCPASTRWLVLGPEAMRAATELADQPAVVQLIVDSWDELPWRSPRLERIARPLLGDVSPLVHALARTPTAFVHGDWKLGNLGSRPDGRTVLIDWSFHGEAAPAADLAHYLSINSARLPESKEATIDRYRVALEAAGIETALWFDSQVDLCLLGQCLWLGWEKALGGGDELLWWEERAERGAARLASSATS